MNAEARITPLNAIAIFVALTFSFCTRANADVVVQHNGAADPITEGWVDTGGNQPAGPVNNDMGFDAWSIDDNSTLGGSFRAYVHQLTDSQISASIANGWQLSTRLRMIDVPDATDFSVSVAFNADTINYGMAFATQNDGDPIVQLIESFGGTNSIGPSFVLDGVGGGYHLYDLKFDAAAGTADLFVDGVERISDYAGYTFVSGEKRIGFGAQQSNSTGHAHYNYVSFSTVPEPSSFVLLLMSSLAMSYRRRRAK